MDVREVILPSGTRLQNVPSDLTDEQIKAGAIAQGFATEDDFVADLGMRDSDYAAHAKTRPANQNFVAGVGGAMKGMGLEAGKMLGLVDQEDVDEHRRQMRGLTSAPGGSVGEFLGYAAPAAATLPIPGANTYTGAALTGGVMGLVAPSSSGREKAINTGVGLGAGFVGKGIGDLAGKGVNRWVSKRAVEGASEQQKNAVRDATQRQALDVGYTLPPSYAGGGRFARTAEALSGKYKTNQLAQIRNQQRTNVLAKESIGLSSEDRLTPEVLQNLRNDAHAAGYVPVRNAGDIAVDKKFKADIARITTKYTSAKRSFPDSNSSDVMNVVKQIDVDGFNASDAIDQSQIMRDAAGMAYRNGDKGLGKAYRESARALEDQIERHLSAQGDEAAEMLKAFRGSRKLMAKTHTIENALIESSGDVDATKMIKDLRKLSGKQRAIANTAQSYRDVMRVPKSGDANPFTVLDMFGATGMTGGALATGVNPAIGLAMPAGRIMARYGALSPMVQKSMAGHSYGPGKMLSATPTITNDPRMQALIRGSVTGGLLGQFAE